MNRKLYYIHPSKIPANSANSLHAVRMCQAFSNQGCATVLVAPGNRFFNRNSAAQTQKYYGGNVDFKMKVSPTGISGVNFILFVSYVFFLLLFSRKDSLIVTRSVHAAYISVLLGKRTIFESHSPIFEYSKRQYSFFKKLIKKKNFSKLIVISEELKKVYLGIFPELNIQVLADACDERSLEEAPFPEEASLQKPTCGYVGGLFKGKGIELIIKVASICPNVEFLVYGGSSEEISNWKQNGADLPNLTFKGFVKNAEIEKAYASFNIALLPNQTYVRGRGEKDINIANYTSPLKMFEYMAYRKVIVASDLKVLREVLTDSNSYLAVSTDALGWKQCIDHIVEHPSVAISKVKQASREFLEKYTWNQRAVRMLTDV